MIVDRVADWIQRRSTASNPSRWFVDWVSGGTRANSGIAVNESSALGYAPLWRAVTLIAGDCAKVPLYLYRRTAGNGKERAAEHPAYRLLRRRPSPHYTAHTFRQTMTGQALLHGNAYAVILRLPGGEPERLEILPPAATTPVVESKDGAERYYYASTIDGALYRYQPENILHLKWFAPDGMRGVGLIDKAKETIGLGLATHKYGSLFFKNQAQPNLILKFPGTLGVEAIKRIGDSWTQAHSGDNAHRVAVLEEGGDAQAFAVNNEQAEFLATREFQIREVSAWTGIPPHKLGDTTRTSYASIEQENRAYLQDCLDQWFVAWEEECWDKLLSVEEQQNDSHLVEFLRAAVISTDTQTEHAVLRDDLSVGMVTLDEARAMLNRPEVPDGLGATYRIPLNTTVLGAEPAPDPKPEPPKAEADDTTARRRAAARKLATEAGRRWGMRLATKGRRESKDSKRLMDWLSAMRGYDVQLLTDCVPIANLTAADNAAAERAATACVAALVVELRQELLELCGQCRTDEEVTLRAEPIFANLESTAGHRLADILCP
jgi:HK97 family phage portal protein